MALLSDGIAYLRKGIASTCKAEAKHGFETQGHDMVKRSRALRGQRSALRGQREAGQGEGDALHGNSELRNGTDGHCRGIVLMGRAKA